MKPFILSLALICCQGWLFGQITSDTVSIGGITSNPQIAGPYQSYVNKPEVNFHFTITRAPKADGTQWYTAYGEGAFQWANTNRTALTATIRLYFSDRRFRTGAPFLYTRYDTIRLDFDLTTNDLSVVLLSWGSSQKIYKTQYANGLITGKDNAGEMVILTLENP